MSCIRLRCNAKKRAGRGVGRSACFSDMTNYNDWRIAHSEASMGWGGQEHRVLAELTGFQKRGCAVWLLAAPQSQIYQRAMESGVPVVPVDFSKMRLPVNIVKFAVWLRKNRIQVLNPHSSRDGWLFGLAGRLAGVPLIIRTRHIDVDYPNPFVSRHAFTTLTDHVLTTSDKITAKFKLLFGLPDSRITTVPTGIDLQRFQCDGPKAGLPVPIAAAGLPLVGMVSVLRSWKGHPLFFQAIKILKDEGFQAHFVVVGGGAQVEKFENRAAEAGVRDCVTFTGHREDVPEVLRALSVLVIPSTRHEGVPQIGLQALATKTAVVGSDVGGIPEIIRPGETGRIFPAGDGVALARAIRATLEESDQTRTMTERGFANVQAAHSLDAMLDRLDAIYSRYIPSK